MLPIPGVLCSVLWGITRIVKESSLLPQTCVLLFCCNFTGMLFVEINELEGFVFKIRTRKAVFCKFCIQIWNFHFTFFWQGCYVWLYIWSCNIVQFSPDGDSSTSLKVFMQDLNWFNANIHFSSFHHCPCSVVLNETICVFRFYFKNNRCKHCLL